MIEDETQTSVVQPAPPIGNETPTTVAHDEDSDLVRKLIVSRILR
jgi:hypothetical protein